VALSGRTALVTGATGFLGRHLIERLISAGAHVTATVRPSTRPTFSRPVDIIECPLEALTSRSFEHHAAGFDFVFHLAGFTPKALGEANNVSSTYTANLNGTRRLLETVPTIRDRLVIASAVDVYGPNTGSIRETSPLAPLNLYAASKLFCESLARTFAAQRNWRLSILRYGHMYGPGEERYQKLIPVTIARLLTGQQPFVTGGGLERRDLLYVTDAIEATVRASSKHLESPIVLNIVRGQSVEVRQIVRLLTELCNQAYSVIDNPAAGPARNLAFDNRAMISALGDWNFVSLRTGLAEEIQHVRSMLAPT
jgi:UDP-glucose 4-epimerase